MVVIQGYEEGATSGDRFLFRNTLAMAPVLTVERASVDDVPALWAIDSHPAVRRWQIPTSAPHQDRYFEQLVRGAEYDADGGITHIYAIALEREVVGCLHVYYDGPCTERNAIIGFNIHPDHWGRGYMTEALQRVVPYIFAHYPVDCIMAQCRYYNIACKKVLGKAGFRAMPQPNLSWLRCLFRRMPAHSTYLRYRQ